MTGFQLKYRPLRFDVDEQLLSPMKTLLQNLAKLYPRCISMPYGHGMTTICRLFEEAKRNGKV
jgi:hypothetical protein